MADVTISLDDTLELDTIIKESSTPIQPINSVKHDKDGSSHKNDFTGFQTNTAVFDPPKPGTYTIKINGQELSVKVKDPSTISVVDNFEKVTYENQNRNLGDVYGGDLTEASRQQNVVYDGSYALSLGDTGSNGKGIISDTDDLNHPQQGDSIQFQIRGESTGGSTRGPIVSILFGVQSEAGYSNISSYVAQVEYRYNRVRLAKFDNGTRVDFNQKGITLPSQKWHSGIVDWGTDDSIRFRLYNASGSEIYDYSKTDSTYQNGGIGFGHRGDDRSNNGACFVDNVKIL